MKQTDGLSTDRLIKICKIIFAEYKLPRKIMCDAGTHSAADEFWEFGKFLMIHQVVPSSYNHHGNQQAEACVKLVRHIMKNVSTLIYYVYLALSQIQ